jgi:hypothetical protein
MPWPLGTLVLVLFAVGVWLANAAQQRAPIRRGLFWIGKAAELEDGSTTADIRVAKRYRLYAAICVTSGAAIGLLWALLR